MRAGAARVVGGAVVTGAVVAGGSVAGCAVTVVDEAAGEAVVVETATVVVPAATTGCPDDPQAEAITAITDTKKMCLRGRITVRL